MSKPSFIKTLLVRIFLSLGAIAVCFITLEIAIRLLKVKQPEKLLTDRSETFYHRERHPESAFVKDDSDNQEIYVIGDSFTEGAGIQEIDTYSRKLEYFLNMNDLDKFVRIHQLGRSGTSTYQQVKLLDRAIAHNADMVILQITLNDTEDWADQPTFKAWRKKTMPQSPVGFLKFLTEKSKIADFIYSKYSSLQAQKGFLEYYENLYSEGYSGLKRFKNSLHTFATKCAETDTDLLVIIFPLFSHSLGENTYPFYKTHDKIHQILEENQIKYLDLLEIFQNLDHERLQVIPHIDPHPNEIAHRMTAEKLLTYLIREGYVDPSHTPVYPTQLDIHKRWEKTFERMTRQQPKK